MHSVTRKKCKVYLYCFCQLSFSPTTPMASHVRVLALLVSILMCCGGLAVLCGLVGHLHGMHTVAFMAAEVEKICYNFSV